MPQGRQQRSSRVASQSAPNVARVLRSGSSQAVRLLDAVADVLMQTETPLTAREIAKTIVNDPKLAPYLGGVTPHKTVQARIATDILSHGARSRFFRFAPGTYGLRYLRDADRYPNALKHIYLGVRRRRLISPERQLFVDPASLPQTMSAGFFHYSDYPLRLTSRLSTHWINPRSPRADKYINVVAFILLMSGDSVLTFEPTAYEEKHGRLSEHISIGLQGSICESDVNLFDNTKIGFFNAVEREVTEFMGYFADHSATISGYSFSPVDMKYLGLVRDDSGLDRRNTLGIVALVQIPQIPTDHRRLGYRNLRWRRIKGYPNDFSFFDGWSQYVFAGLGS